MDHWGDPWADDGADSKPLPKHEQHDENHEHHEVTTPPPNVSSAPIAVNGFLDDAQWGSFERDEGFGAWASSPAKPAFAHTTAHEAEGTTRVSDEEDTLGANELSSTPFSHTEGGDNGKFRLEDEGWGDVVYGQEGFANIENVISEPSDSATTIQPEDAPEHATDTLNDELRRDDEPSTRPSSSPSDSSHLDAPVESPRTSIEEDRAVGDRLGTDNGSGGENVQITPLGEILSEPEQKHIGGGPKASTSDGSDAPQEEGLGSLSVHDTTDLGNTYSTEKGSMEGKVQTAEFHASSRAILSGVGVDMSLLAELFPIPTSPNKIPDAPNDPIFSTSSRKAWYRLTRKQTLREYKTGTDDDTYLRVTWANSHIQAEAKKIVSRWASEERISGRAGGGGLDSKMEKSAVLQGSGGEIWEVGAMSSMVDHGSEVKSGWGGADVG